MFYIAISADKDLVRKSINKRNGKAAEPSGVVSEMVKSLVKPEFDMITDLLNQIIVERVVLLELDLALLLIALNEKERLEREIYRRLKLTEYVLKIVDRVIKKLKRQ